jgi:hypothetical protein
MVGVIQFSEHIIVLKIKCFLKDNNGLCFIESDTMICGGQSINLKLGNKEICVHVPRNGTDMDIYMDTK